jgi:hypothetical protein
MSDGMRRDRKEGQTSVGRYLGNGSDGLADVEDSPASRVSRGGKKAGCT